MSAEDLAREATADVAVRSLVAGTRRAPPLWAREHEGRVVDLCVGLLKEHTPPATPAITALGWFEAVDHEGRSR